MRTLGSPRKKLLVAMVGLPARGKSWIARHLARWLAWSGLACRVFNVGSYRRARLGAGQGSAFFDPTNESGAAARTALAREALDDACGWLVEEGDVAIHDATNGTRARRAEIAETAARHGVELLFVESICDDPEIVDANVRATKLSSPDYAEVDEVTAVADFRARIALYETTYEPLDPTVDDAYSFVQVFTRAGALDPELGRDLRVHRVESPIAAKVVFYLLNARPSPRVFFFTRHGQSVANLRDKLGGDTPLTLRGDAYARALARWTLARSESLGRPVEVWTSTRVRSIETARHLPFPRRAVAALDEIDAGICEGMTYDEIRRRMPDEWEARARDKLGYRYPKGESYLDVIDRLAPVVLELERASGPVLVVGHQAIIRVLYGYFMERPREVCPRLDVPLHTVLEVEPRAHGADERRHPLGPAVVDRRDGD